MTRKGSCLCGAVQFELNDDNDTGIACHCTSCRKSSSTHSFNVRTTIDAVKVTKGTPKTYDDNATDSGTTAQRSFCGNCGSSLWTDPLSRPGARVVKVSVYWMNRCKRYVLMGKVGALDDAKDIKLGAEIYVDSAIPAQLMPSGAKGHKQYEGPMRKEV